MLFVAKGDVIPAKAGIQSPLPRRSFRCLSKRLVNITMIINKKIITLLLSLLVIAGTVAGVIFIVNKEQEPLTTDLAKESLADSVEKVVRGNSLAGLIEDGETVRAFLNYYDSNEIERNDIILYSFAGSDTPLIKIIRGIPDDRFELSTTPSGWHILINDEILKNSKDEPYLINERGYRMLSLFVESFQGVIPADAYLILGNLVGGEMDSTQFGLVHKTDILGKVQNP